MSPLVDDDKTTQSGLNNDSIGLNQIDNDKLANFEAIQEQLNESSNEKEM